jgi:CubicO group peptidase (beta-lactamase class C family)
MSDLTAVLRQLSERRVPGLSAVVVKRDGVVEQHAVGRADIASGRAVTPDTAFLWFSMTKIVTATAAMQLVERGKLSLDDPVQRHLPAFPRPRSGWPEIRVRHLLSHSSGLANPVPVRWVHPAGRPGREPHRFTHDLLRRHGKLRFPAGTKAGYSNLGYLALGEVISAAAGRRYEDVVREQILAPLAMTCTGFDFPADPADAATGYQPRLHPMTPLFRRLLPKGIVGDNLGRFLSFRPFCVDGPAYGGLIGSATDAARFMTVHINGGRADDVELLTHDSVARMQTIAATGSKLDVGLGWYRRHSDRRSSEPYLEHLGGGGGYFNMMRVYPRRGLGVVVMGNASSYDHQRVAAEALAGS